jgi:hypothetical protein
LAETFSTVVVHATPIARSVAQSSAGLASAGAFRPDASRGARRSPWHRPSPPARPRRADRAVFRAGLSAGASCRTARPVRGQSLAPVLFAVPVPDPSKPAIRVPARLGMLIVVLDRVRRLGWLVPSTAARWCRA